MLRHMLSDYLTGAGRGSQREHWRMSATLVVRVLAGGYGHRAIFESLDLTVAPGDVAGVVGANGSGKSTLLWVFAGTSELQEGSVNLAQNALMTSLSGGQVAKVRLARLAALSGTRLALHRWGASLALRRLGLTAGLLHRRLCSGLGRLEPYVREKGDSRLGEPGGLGRAVEERISQFGFQLLDRRAQRHPGNIEGLRCSSEVQRLGDGNEVLEQGDVHGQPFVNPARIAVVVSGYADAGFTVYESDRIRADGLLRLKIICTQGIARENFFRLP